jgi:hypothetical protein
VLHPLLVLLLLQPLAQQVLLLVPLSALQRMLLKLLALVLLTRPKLLALRLLTLLRKLLSQRNNPNGFFSHEKSALGRFFHVCII